jgi:hypothetical protein
MERSLRRQSDMAGNRRHAFAFVVLVGAAGAAPWLLAQEAARLKIDALTLNFASWNLIGGFLRQLNRLTGAL